MRGARTSLLLILPLILSGCRSGDPGISRRYFAFDTTIQVEIYDSDDAKLLDDIGGMFDLYSDLSDNFISYQSKGVTNVYDVNQTNDPVEILPELYDMLKFAKDKEPLFRGRFNLMIGALAKLWKKAVNETKERPAQEDIDAARADMEASDLLFLEGNKVQRVGKGEIDLGAVAKGYAIDKVAKYLAANNVKRYLVTARSSLAFGTRKDGSSFRVGLSDMPGKAIKCRDTALGTSSISEQYFVAEDGTTYSHIVDPLTGNAVSKYDAVIVQGADAGLLDMASTAFMMMDLAEIEAVSMENGMDYLAIKDKGEVARSPGIEYVQV